MGGSEDTLLVGDVLWSTLLALVIGAAIRWIMTAGRYTAGFVAARPLRNTVLCARGGLLRSRVRGSDEPLAVRCRLIRPDHSERAGLGPSRLVHRLPPVGAGLQIHRLRALPAQSARWRGLSRPLPGRGVGLPRRTAAGVRRRASDGSGHGGLNRDWPGAAMPLSSVVLVRAMLGNAGTVPVVVLAGVVLPPCPDPKGKLGAGPNRTPRSAAP